MKVLLVIAIFYISYVTSHDKYAVKSYPKKVKPFGAGKILINPPKYLNRAKSIKTKDVFLSKSRRMQSYEGNTTNTPYTVFQIVGNSKTMQGVPDSPYFLVDQTIPDHKPRVKKVLPDYVWSSLSRIKRSAPEEDISNNTSSSTTETTVESPSTPKPTDSQQTKEVPTNPVEPVTKQEIVNRAHEDGPTNVTDVKETTTAVSKAIVNERIEPDSTGLPTRKKNKVIKKLKPAVGNKKDKSVVKLNSTVVDKKPNSAVGDKKPKSAVVDKKPKPAARHAQPKTQKAAGTKSKLKQKPKQANRSVKAKNVNMRSGKKGKLKSKSKPKSGALRRPKSQKKSNKQVNRSQKKGSAKKTNKKGSVRKAAKKGNSRSTAKRGRTSNVNKKGSARNANKKGGARNVNRKGSARNLNKNGNSTDSKILKETRRLTGARQALIEDYPYTVSIQKDGVHWCSGAILNPRMVITTANCLWKADRVSRMQVRCGSSYSDQGGQMAGIQEVLKHPKWSLRHAPDHDVALILLDRAIQFSHSVHGVDLPNRVMWPAFEDAWITSFGSERRDGVYEEHEDALQVYHAYVMSNETCNNITTRFGVIVTENFICFTQTGKTSPCTRDTGAPAVSDGVLWGLASWSIRKLCGTERFPSVFSYTASHSNMDFITEAMRTLMSDKRMYQFLDRTVRPRIKTVTMRQRPLR